MRIGYDATSLCRQITGIEYYALNLIKALLQIDSKNEYLLFCLGNLHPDLRTYSHRFEVRICPVQNQLFCEQFWLPYQATIGSLDLLHCPAFPPSPLYPGRLIMTFPDASMWLFPKSFSKRGLYYFKTLCPIGAQKSLKVLAYSQSVKDDILKVVDIPREKIYVTHLAASDVFKPIADKDSLKAIKDKYKLPERFILSVGTVQPRKNFVRLTQAYKLLKDRRNIQHKLVIAGRLRLGTEELKSTMDKLQLQDDLILTDHVPDEDLVSIYNLADLFVFVSLYEGFGIPPLEAMQCGLPVIASNTSSIPEIVGDAARLVDPYDIEQISTELENLIFDDDLKDKLREKGLKRAELFSWQRTAQETLNIYEAISHQQLAKS